MKGAAMKEVDYTEENRRKDFHFFTDNHNRLYEQYGKCYIAIRNGKVLGGFSTVAETLERLADKYKPGTYSIQECNGKESANRVRIQRMTIGA